MLHFDEEEKNRDFRRGLKLRSCRYFVGIFKSFFRSLISTNPPDPPLKKEGGNHKELLLKSPFEKGGFRGI